MSGDLLNSNQQIPEIFTKETKYEQISRELYFAWGKLVKGTILSMMSSENFTTFE